MYDSTAKTSRVSPVLSSKPIIKSPDRKPANSAGESLATPATSTKNRGVPYQARNEKIKNPTKTFAATPAATIIERTQKPCAVKLLDSLISSSSPKIFTKPPIGSQFI